MRKSPFALALAICSSQALAMFCPNGFNQMNMGDTIEQVTKNCGNPDEKKTSKEVPFQAQEWNYYVHPDPSQPGTLKMSVAFGSDKKAVNITVNGTSLMATTICGGNIQVGDDVEAIKSACGKPAFTNQGAQPSANANDNAPEITELRYNTTPPTTLIFTNGKLTERK
jgi:hypothetical protein